MEHNSSLKSKHWQTLRAQRDGATWFNLRRRWGVIKESVSVIGQKRTTDTLWFPEINGPTSAKPRKLVIHTGQWKDLKTRMWTENCLSCKDIQRQRTRTNTTCTSGSFHPPTAETHGEKCVLWCHSDQPHHTNGCRQGEITQTLLYSHFTLINAPKTMYHLGKICFAFCLLKHFLKH